MSLSRRSDNALFIAALIWVVIMVSITLISIIIEVNTKLDPQADAAGIPTMCAYPQVVDLSFYTPDQVNGRCLATSYSYRVEVKCANAPATLSRWIYGPYVTYPTYSIVRCPETLPYSDAWRMMALVS